MSSVDYGDGEDSLLEDLIKEEKSKIEIKVESESEEIEANSETEPKNVDSDTDASPPKKRKQSSKNALISAKEEELMHLVFGNKSKLIANLKGSKESQLEKSKTEREPAWHDSGDELEADDVIDYNRKGAPAIRKEGKYKEYLEKNFKTILGTPDWANLDRKDDDEDSEEEILQTVGHVRKQISTTKLPKNRIQCKRLKDLNRATYGEGPGIVAVEFHPTSSVALVAGRTGMANIYTIDGQKNDKLHSVAFENFPIKSARLSRDGMEAILGSSRKFFYTYNLMTGHNQRVFLPKDITKMTDFELSPCGQYLAIIGRFGEIHLLNSASKELICTLKQEHQSTALAFNADSSKLFSHSCDAEISVFDMKTQRLQHRFIDDGCVNGITLNISPNGEYVAAGSQQGVVNIYDIADTLNVPTPQPLKRILNLTTSITTTKFNHSTEILGICSNAVNDSIKLVHLPSGTVFNNFPDFQAKLGKINVISFSPQSGYMALGNLAKEVSLFRLKHFNNY